MFTKLEEFTEAEFLAYLKELWDAEFKSEAESVEAVRKFVAIADHPSGSDLLFFPPATRPDTPEGVLQEIKEWRAVNGKPLFKSE